MNLRAASFVVLGIFAIPAVAQTPLPAADKAAACRAAGFALKGKQWRACDAPQGSAYTPGTIEDVRDLNGDGRPEAIITEGSTFCFGGDEVGFSIVSKQPGAGWKLITSATGVPKILATKGVAGWPDLEIGGQGFCFPVQRWNGKEYRTVRYQYQGKACKPQR